MRKAVKGMSAFARHTGEGRYPASPVRRLDRDHGDAIPAFNAMGRPAYPSIEQIEALREAGCMAPPARIPVHDGRFDMEIPPQGLVIVELPPQ